MHLVQEINIGTVNAYRTVNIHVVTFFSKLIFIKTSIEKTNVISSGLDLFSYNEIRIDFQGLCLMYFVFQDQMY